VEETLLLMPVQRVGVEKQFDKQSLDRRCVIADRRALVKLERLPIVAKVPLVFAKTARPPLRSAHRPSCQLVYEELREDKPARAAQREMPHRKR